MIVRNWIAKTILLLTFKKEALFRLPFLLLPDTNTIKEAKSKHAGGGNEMFVRIHCHDNLDPLLFLKMYI